MLSWSSGNASGKQFYLEVGGSNPGEYEVQRKKKLKPAVNKYSFVMGIGGRGRVAGG